MLVMLVMRLKAKWRGEMRLPHLWLNVRILARESELYFVNWSQPAHHFGAKCQRSVKQKEKTVLVRPAGWHVLQVMSVSRHALPVNTLIAMTLEKD